MTCKKCARWDECSKKDGTTRFYGRGIAVDNAEVLCKRFRTQRQEKFKFESWRLFRELFGSFAWTNILVQWLAIYLHWRVVSIVCAFVAFVLAGGYMVCDTVYTKKLRAAIKKEFDKEKKDG